MSADEARAYQDSRNLRQRLSPAPGSSYYMHLSDLRLAMDHLASHGRGEILDFGCGGSPYRSLFSACNGYRRADLEGVDDLDYVIRPGVGLSAPDQSFDCLLSSQVLEHVALPSEYLADCHRILRPGGVLLLTTHGTFPDHSVPWDFQRWTAFGLRRDLEVAGFRVEELLKLTTGPRAALQLLESTVERIPGKGLPFGMLFQLFRSVWRRRTAAFHKWSDQALASFRVVDDIEHPHHRLYLGLAMVARKNGK